MTKFSSPSPNICPDGKMFLDDDETFIMMTKFLLWWPNVCQEDQFSVWMWKQSASVIVLKQGKNLVHAYKLLGICLDLYNSQFLKNFVCCPNSFILKQSFIHGWSSSNMRKTQPCTLVEHIDEKVSKTLKVIWSSVGVPEKDKKKWTGSRGKEGSSWETGKPTAKAPSKAPNNLLSSSATTFVV